MLCALIMAGGKGTRFWPLSTEKKPKQFLNLLADKTMIQMTVDRLRNLIPTDRIFIVTSEMYKELVKEQLPELPEKNIILEPVGRNTAPCIALSAMLIEKQFKDSTIAVLPADHLIKDENEFNDVLKVACTYVENNEEHIVTLGIKPSRPETGYGYINYSDKIHEINNHDIIKVNKFVEKPSLEIAKRYVELGNYLWNSGMFVWKAKTIIELCKLYIENTYEILNEIALCKEEEFEEKLNEKYQYVDNISVDYGIMEKASNICVIPSDFGWDDIGTWDAVERYRVKDTNDNIYEGNIKSIKSKNNIIISKSKSITILDIENIYCIETDDGIFIGKKESINNLKNIKDDYKLA